MRSAGSWPSASGSAGTPTWRWRSSRVSPESGSWSWHWPLALRERGPACLAGLAGPKGNGFEIAREALGSRVERVVASVYDLSPQRLGKFDVVVCGSLLLHLRDPVGALGAIRS